MWIHTNLWQIDGWIDIDTISRRLSLRSPLLLLFRSTPKHWVKTHGKDMVSEWRLALWLAEGSLNCNPLCFPHEAIKRSLEFWLVSLWWIPPPAAVVQGMRLVLSPLFIFFLLESVPHSLECGLFGFLCVCFWRVLKNYDFAGFPAFCCC